MPGAPAPIDLGTLLLVRVIRHVEQTRGVLTRLLFFSPPPPFLFLIIPYRSPATARARARIPATMVHERTHPATPQPIPTTWTLSAGLSDIEQNVLSSGVSGYITSETNRINLGQVARASVEQTPTGGTIVEVVLTSQTESETAKLTAADLNKVWTRGDGDPLISVGKKVFYPAVVTSVEDATITAPPTQGATIDFIFSQIVFSSMTELELEILSLGAKRQVFERAGADVLPAYVARVDVFENPASRVNIADGLVDGSTGGTIVQIVLYPDTPSRVGLVSVLTLASKTFFFSFFPSFFLAREMLMRIYVLPITIMGVERPASVFSRRRLLGLLLIDLCALILNIDGITCRPVTWQQGRL